METNFLKNRTFLFILLQSVILFAGCSKKDLPAPVNGNPVFKFNGTIGGESVDLQAGINGVYMYTDYYRDNQSLYSLKGTFAKDTCVTCEPYLSFEFKDAEASINSSLSSGIQTFFRDSIFNSYSLDSVQIANTIESFQFTPIVNQQGAVYNWSFGDGSFSQQFNPLHLYSTQGIQSVKLKSTYNGVSDSLSIPVDVTMLSTCRSQFIFTVDTFLNKVYVQADNVSFANYSWDFGNGTIGQGIYDTATYALPGIYTIKLTSTIGGCTSTFFQKVNLTNNPSAVLSNFRYSSELNSYTSFIQRINRGACVITYHKNGKVYKSYKNDSQQDQSGKEIFRVISVNPYDYNYKNQATVSMKGEVNTTLYNVTNSADSISIKSNSIQVAIAYPN